jgi:N,N'-diacetyllegionaminate synthase
MKTLIIAEAGVNHNGDLDLAKNLIKVAANSGADFVKFQFFSAGRLVTKEARKARYQLQNAPDGDSQFEMIRDLEISEEMYRELIDEAELYGIGIFSTAFDIESADSLVACGQNLFKIPSGEITNLPYLRHIGTFGKRIILSTGMSSLEEVETAIDVLSLAGTPKAKITVLHCTSSYPAPFADINLLAMQTLREKLEVKVGYSDHTLGTEVAIAAVALGAEIIEKHFTLDRNLPGPDQRASLEPGELKLMVSQIRKIELALGDGVKRPLPSEMENIDLVRKSIVTKVPISKGELFSESNITTKRPGTGISPMRWESIIGSRASRDYDADELIDDA